MEANRQYQLIYEFSLTLLFVLLLEISTVFNFVGSLIIWSILKVFLPTLCAVAENINTENSLLFSWFLNY